MSRPSRATAAALVLAGLLTAAMAMTPVPRTAATGLPATSLTASFSGTWPAYDQPFTVSGTVSPAWSGGYRTVYLSTWTGSRWVVVGAQRLTGPSYSITYRTTWLGRRPYLVWTPATTRNAAARSAPVYVTHHKFGSTTTAAMSALTTLIDGTVVMAGRVSSAGSLGGRTVALYRSFHNGLHRERTTTTDAYGRWSFRVPSWFLTNRYLVARVWSTASTAAATSTALQEHVLPLYSPAGSASEHAWLLSTSGLRQRWNGCRARITYRVDPGGLGSTFVSEVHTAMARVQQASGIHMTYLGTTTAVPPSLTNWPSDTNIVVAFARDSATAWDLSGPTVGEGGAVRVRWATDFGGPVAEITRAGVVLQKGAAFDPGFATAMSRGQVLLHELGHAMGLGHVGATSQVMYPAVHYHPRYGAGDLFGLERAGYGLGGCTHTSTAARVDVLTAVGRPTAAH